MDDFNYQKELATHDNDPVPIHLEKLAPDTRLKSTTGVFEEIETPAPHNYWESMSEEEYGKDGYYHNDDDIKPYKGGEDGESYYTSADSDLTYLDVIQSLP